MGPKVLLRRQRFLRSFAAIREHPPGLWARLIDPGYVDQSQFVRDFRDFMGMPARTYFAVPRLFVHARREQGAGRVAGPSIPGLRYSALPASDPSKT